MERIQNYINGQYTNPKENKWLTNFEPATGLPLNDIPISTVADIEMAYTAAEEAFKEWSQTSAEKRSNILHNIAQLIEAQLDSLAALETKDNGKPLSLAQTIDIPRAAANFRFFANAITQFSSEAHDTLGKNTINYTLRQPLGVVGCISPWNLPLYLFTWKIAPALAAGNTVIAKPSELTPLTASKLGEIATKAGLPKGVLNIIQGPGNPSGQALISHPNIKAISFTGGTKTGAHIAKTLAPQFKKLSLELGGKNPCIIDETANLKLSAKRIVWGKFLNAGQTCIATDYILIHEKVKPDFIEALQLEIKRAYGINPKESKDFARIINTHNFNRLVNMLKNERLLLGGDYNEDDLYISPTVIDEPSLDSEVMKGEIFGPILPILSYTDENEIPNILSKYEKPLSLYVFSNNKRFSKKIINTLFHMKSYVFEVHFCYNNSRK